MYEYAIFFLTSFLFTESVGIFLSIMFGYIISYIICSFTFSMLRKSAGGYHCTKFKHCFFVSNLLFALGAITAQLTQEYSFVMWLLATYSVFFMFPTYPKPSENSPSRGYSEDIRFRKKYRNIFIPLSIFSLISSFYEYGFVIPNVNWEVNNYIVSTSLSCGILMVSIITSDFIEKVLKRITFKKG